MLTASVQHIPNVSNVDFSNIDDITDFATRLIESASNAGLFADPAAATTTECKVVVAAAREWIKHVDARITEMSAGEALSLIDVYDIAHRIAFRRPADRRMIDRIKLSAFEARLHGDKSVDEYELFHAIGAELNRGNKAYFNRQLQWYSMSLDRWHKNFPHGVRQKTMSNYDTLRQVEALLDENLWAFESDQATYKSALLTNTLHYFDELQTLSRKELAILDKILTAAAQYIADARLECYTAVIEDAKRSSKNWR